MKIAHISDVHIRNYRYHDVYKSVQEKLIQDLKTQDVDEIFVTGDIAHTKTSLSPDYFDFAAQFFKALSKVAMTRIFIGNHDVTLNNKHRQDAITPVVEAIDSDKIKFYKDSCKVELSNDCDLYHLSIYDKDWSTLPEPNESKINISTFHGTVKGAETDIGWIMKDGEISLEELKKYDYSLLGDIHKSNQAVDDDGRARYAGSLIQQNYGESDDKGYLIWDIDGKNDFRCEHQIISNPKPFHTITLKKGGKYNKSNIPENCRLKIKSGPCGYKEVEDVLEEIKKENNIYSSTYLLSSESVQSASSKFSLANEDGEKEDVRDLSVQKDLIKKYLSDRDDDIVKRAIKFNEKYDKEVSDKDKLKNVNWSLKKLKWDNLFNYGEDNEIDFSSMEGIVGVLGENYSGKSSTIDSFLYTVFNSTSKDFRKNLHVINQEKEKGRGEVQMGLNGDTYKIVRESEKYIRKLHGEESVQARTSNKFSKIDGDGNEINLEAESRRKTDKEIRKVFGNLDEFELTSLTSQFGSLEYISKGSTKRKEILAKFLDLECFDEKYDLATDDLTDLRADLKRYEGSNLSSDLESLRGRLTDSEMNAQALEHEISILETKVSKLQKQNNKLQNKIESVPAESILIDSVISKLESKSQKIEGLKESVDKYQSSIKQNKQDIDSAKEDLSSINKPELLRELAEYEAVENEYQELVEQYKNKKKRKDNLEKYEGYIEEAPCNTEYSDCQLVKEANEKLQELKGSDQEFEKLKDKKEKKKSELNSYDYKSIQDSIDEYNQLEKQVSDLSSENTSIQLKIERAKNKIDKLHDEIDNLENKKQKYYDNQDAIENLEKLKKKKNEKQTELVNFKRKLRVKKDKLKELYKNIGFIEQKIESVKQEKKELDKKRFEFEALKAYRSSMHSNGIPFEIIKTNISKINKEISKVTGDLFDFEIFFKHDDGDLEVYISHPDQQPRIIETGSGAEKTVAAISIRLALLNITTMPKGDIFILDEPATELDADNMQSFIDILNLIKSNFRVVIVISHLEFLKDAVDRVITIDKDEEGYAHIKEE